jgi:alpha-D-ribose 1-methylphosphonate 5-triphosphate diphosphatase PhnM
MGKKKEHHISKHISAENVKLMLKQNFEPGRQDKCKLAVYRNVIRKATGISERTFWRYLDEKPTAIEDDPNQLKINF